MSSNRGIRTIPEGELPIKGESVYRPLARSFLRRLEKTKPTHWLYKDFADKREAFQFRKYLQTYVRRVTGVPSRGVLETTIRQDDDDTWVCYVRRGPNYKERLGPYKHKEPKEQSDVTT